MTVFFMIFLVVGENLYTVPQPPMALDLDTCIEAALLFNKDAVESTSPYRALCLPMHTLDTPI
jgi:hypothetical protein